MLFALALLLVGSVTASEPWKCTDTLLTSFPANIPTVTPVALEYASDNDCTWSITVQKSTYLVLTVTSNFAEGDLFEIYNDKGNYLHKFNQTTPSNPRYPSADSFDGDLPAILNDVFYLSYLGTGSTYIHLKANGGRGWLSFNIEVRGIDDKLSSQPTVVPAVLPLLTNNSLELKCESAIVFRTISPAYNFRHDSCQFFEFDNGLIFVGGLASQTDGVPAKFNAKARTLICYETFEDAYLLAASDSPSINVPWSVRTLPDYDKYSYTFSEESLLTTYSPSANMDSLVSVSGNGSVNLYNGFPGYFFVPLREIAGDDSISSTPQNLYGSWKTYGASAGSEATVDLQRISNSLVSMDSYGIDVRKGFFATPYYGYLTGSQNFKTQIGDSSNHIFSTFIFTVEDMGQGSVDVAVFQRGGDAAHQVVTMESFNSSTTYSLQGYYMTIKFTMNEVMSIGALVSWEVDHAPVQQTTTPVPNNEATTENGTDEPGTSTITPEPTTGKKGAYSTSIFTAFSVATFLLYRF